MTNLESLVQRWNTEGARVLPSASSSETLAAFRALGYAATTDVVALYEGCGGMEQMDDNYWRLWPLPEIMKENSESSGSGVLFGDYLIDSWRYILKPVNAEISAVYVDYYNGRDLVQVAPSVEEFLENLLLDPIELLERRLADGEPR